MSTPLITPVVGIVTEAGTVLRGHVYYHPAFKSGELITTAPVKAFIPGDSPEHPVAVTADGMFMIGEYSPRRLQQ